MSDDQMVFMVVTSLAAAMGALVLMARTMVAAKTAAEQSTAANQAVNNVGPGEHRLLDMVTLTNQRVENIEATTNGLAKAQEDFHDRGWAQLEPPIDTALGLTRHLDYLEALATGEKDAHDIIRRDVAAIHNMLAEHIRLTQSGLGS